MYLKEAIIQKVRAVEAFRLEFTRPQGWHVLIGDNGSGKSTIVQAIGVGLIGPLEAPALRLVYEEWINSRKPERGVILLTIQTDAEDGVASDPPGTSETRVLGLIMQHDDNRTVFAGGLNGIYQGPKETSTTSPGLKTKTIWDTPSGCFSAGYGPFRRFTGGVKEKEDLPERRAAAHLSLFGEDVALTESLRWLKQLNYQKLENKPDAAQMLDCMLCFINQSDLLPHGVRLKEVSSAGVMFVDGNNAMVNVTQLSDGFRSILSMTFELIRQLVRCYGQDRVLRHLKADKPFIDLPGVVLIDEIDAHLHPTWQTRIGKWFTRVFPAMQFIVTTHSPLVCRACDNGTIWRLASPGSDRPSGQVIGHEKDQLVFGSILDAYGTELFGEGIERSNEGHEKMRRLAELNIRSIRNALTQIERSELEDLKRILPSSSESLEG